MGVRTGYKLYPLTSTEHIEPSFEKGNLFSLSHSCKNKEPLWKTLVSISIKLVAAIVYMCMKVVPLIFSMLVSSLPMKLM